MNDFIVGNKMSAKRKLLWKWSFVVIKTTLMDFVKTKTKKVKKEKKVACRFKGNNSRMSSCFKSAFFFISVFLFSFFSLALFFHHKSDKQDWNDPTK